MRGPFNPVKSVAFLIYDLPKGNAAAAAAMTEKKKREEK